MSNVGQNETPRNMSWLTGGLGLRCAAKLILACPQGASSLGVGSTSGAWAGFSSGREAIWSHVLLAASRLHPHLLCSVEGTPRSQWSICPHCGAIGGLLPCWPGSVCRHLPSPSAAADRVASTWMSTEAGLLGLCKRVSAPPSACLSSKENGSGLNQYQRLKFSRLWSEGTTSNHLPSSF